MKIRLMFLPDSSLLLANNPICKASNSLRNCTEINVTETLQPVDVRQTRLSCIYLFQIMLEIHVYSQKKDAVKGLLFIELLTDVFMTWV